MIRLHSEGFCFQFASVTLTVICRAIQMRTRPVNGTSELRRPAAILTIKTFGLWQCLTVLGGRAV